MGYTSKQLDEEMTYSDMQLLCILEPVKQEVDIQKMAYAVNMGFGGKKSSSQDTEVKRHVRKSR